MCGAIPPLPQHVFVAWCLVKHRDNFIFYQYLSTEPYDSQDRFLPRPNSVERVLLN